MSTDIDGLKCKILQLAAATDRGAMADGGKSAAYLGTKSDMRELVEHLTQLKPVNEPLSAKMLCGTWELVYTTVQLFRASPFFQMVEAGYDDPEKSNLLFKLHQLQTGSWGISSIGRITQVLDLVGSEPLQDELPPEDGVADAVVTTDVDGEEAESASSTSTLGATGSLESEVDLILLPLTSLPVVGFWKLLPTFGGCIATRAYCALSGDFNEVIELTVQSTKLKAVRDVPLLPVAGKFFEGREFPTGDVTKMVIGKVPVTSQSVVYMDESLRIMKDGAGELFVYARPLAVD